MVVWLLQFCVSWIFIDEESELENDKSDDEVSCSSVDSENTSNHASDEQPGPSGFSSKEIPQNCDPCEDDEERTLGIILALTYSW